MVIWEKVRGILAGWRKSGRSAVVPVGSEEESLSIQHIDRADDLMGIYEPPVKVSEEALAMLERPHPQAPAGEPRTVLRGSIEDRVRAAREGRG